MSPIVKNVAVVLVIPITMFGLYIILHGHLTPGGGFPGGAIMASLVVLFFVAFGKEWAKKINKGILFFGESFGLALFGLLAFLGLGTSFFHNFLANSDSLFGMSIPFGANSGFLWSGGIIPLMNIAVGLEVFAALSIIAVVMFLENGKVMFSEKENNVGGKK